MSGCIAALAAAAVVLLLAPVRPLRVDLRSGRVLVIVGTAGLVVVVGSVVPVRWPLVVIALGAAAAVRQQVAARRGRAVADRRAAAVIEACEGLAADLRAGRPPVSALQAAARDWPELQGVADVANLGGDVPASLRALAEAPGAGGLRTVAAAWVVAHGSGAGLADSVGLAARVVRDERATARVVETELASARATARLLAVLPLGVLLAGKGSGGDPFGFLLATTPGLVLLGLGLGLSWVGLAWLERIGRSVQG